MAKQIVDDNKFTGVRLPKIVTPKHYDLWLKPNFDDFTFQGKIKIDYTAEENVDSVVLHSQDLEILDGSIDQNSLTAVTYSPSTETATLKFKDKIASKGSICLNFKGQVNDKLKGFYRTTFDVDGQKIYAGTTQFEATDARRCLPCWDEPAFKATFTVSMVISKWIDVNGKKYERLVLSNMPEVSRTGSDDEMTITFDKTPIMSTYLLAFVVGPFEKIEASHGKCPVRVYTTPGKTEQGRYALDVACKSLDYYENYFNIKYPLPKMDLIAIPDFNAGAMENWGLVTYRETCILVDPKNTATNSKQYVALVVAHELAHQWFGNLVTMEWWTHLWLNEGFATFMEYLCVDHIFPEYTIWSQFVTDQYCRALELDALDNSHPIEVTVHRSSEINEIFDDISYAKGATVIRMLYEYIGDAKFRVGMSEYLNKFAYKNAATEDLWESLGKASNKPVQKLMAGWTGQKGFPWLSVEHEIKDGNIELTLTQNKFSADGKVSKDDANTLWMVPINAVSGNETSRIKALCLLDGKSCKTTVMNVGDNWIKLNPGTVGLYRTAYPLELADRLKPAISNKNLAPMDRLGIQSDYHALCQAGKMDTVELLKLMQAYKKELVYTVWCSISGSLGHISLLLSETEFHDKFHAYTRDLLSVIFSQVGWVPKSNESHTDAMTRALIIGRLVAACDTQVIEEAKRRFVDHIAGKEVIPADLRAACYRAAAAYGTQSDYDALMKIYKTDPLHEEKNRALRALGFIRDTERLNKAIEFALSSEVRNQDRMYFFVSLGSSKPPVAWETLKANKDMIRSMYEGTSMVARFVKFCSENFTSQERANEMEKFFDENKFEAERTVKQSIETVRLNADWLNRDRESMKAFLSSY